MFISPRRSDKHEFGDMVSLLVDHQLADEYFYVLNATTA
jgi:hypothetical protein